eukprot:scaffold1883_cov261-Pinguiococcus_pyrenoidosus.AAC.36
MKRGKSATEASPSVFILRAVIRDPPREAGAGHASPPGYVIVTAVSVGASSFVAALQATSEALAAFQQVLRGGEPDQASVLEPPGGTAASPWASNGSHHRSANSGAESPARQGPTSRRSEDGNANGNDEGSIP